MNYIRILKLVVIWFIVVILLVMIPVFAYGTPTLNGPSLWILSIIITYLIMDKIK
jgi:hypothetical protein